MCNFHEHTRFYFITQVQHLQIKSLKQSTYRNFLYGHNHGSFGASGFAITRGCAEGTGVLESGKQRQRQKEGER